MGRINIYTVAFLWLGVVSSALAVVSVTHRARIATSDLEKLRHQAADLHVQSGQYLLERGSLAVYTRIEKLAVDELEMTVPDADEIILVKP